MMMLQPFSKVDIASIRASISGTFAATGPQQSEVADTTEDYSGDFWYQQLDDFAVTETDPDADAGYFDSILAALVPDGTDLQQVSSDSAATADCDGRLPMPRTFPLQPATEPFWASACGIQTDHDMSVPDAAVTAAAALGQTSTCIPEVQPCMAAWSAQHTTAAHEYCSSSNLTAAAAPATVVPAPLPAAAAAAAADVKSGATVTRSLTRQLYRTAGDAGSGCSSNSSPAIMNVRLLAAPTTVTVPALGSPTRAVGITKPTASAGGACDGLALRREANKYSQRRQRYRRQQDMEQVKAELSELADKHAATKSKLDSLRSENSALVSRLSNITAKWQGTVALNASLQHENTAHKVEIAGLQQQLAKVQAQLGHQQLQCSQQQWSQPEVWNSSGVCWQQHTLSQPHWG